MSREADAVILVKRAFEAAKLSGKDNWQRMTIPVLKNRILLITHGTFREAAFGASSFGEFVRRLPSELVQIDSASSPGAVILQETEPSEVAHSVSHYPRIRTDLWHAILDSSGQRRYVWDEPTGRAVLADPTEDSRATLPTVGGEELVQWRVAFASKQAEGQPSEVVERLNRWAREPIPAGYLPARLRPLWNAELKRRVEERLRLWFEQQGISTPTIVSQTKEPAARSSDEHQLRRFLIRCLEVMTHSELASLQVPAGVVMRAHPARQD